MHFLRTHILVKAIAFVFALHIFNISVDAPDPNNSWINENQPLNEMESITEIVCEQILNFENTFPEHKDRNNEKGSPLVSHFHLFFYDQPVVSTTPFAYSQPLYKKQTENYLSQFSPDVLIPPPKA